MLVDIDGVFLTRENMECLFHDTDHMNSSVLSAYIHLMRAEEHLRNRKGGKVFLENTFVSSILKRDGKIDADEVNPKVAAIKKRVDNYLDHNMIFIPINIEKCHWYLAVVNALECEIHVLDSLGDGMSRTDLTETLIGLDRQISIVERLKKLKKHNWTDLHVAKWPVIDKITRPMQTDSSSCGLFMINYMEYWTGTELSDSFTQEDMERFRSKLIAILWDSELNMNRACLHSEHDNKDGGSTSQIEIPDRPAKIIKRDNLNIPSTSNMPMGEEELILSLRKYINSLSDANTLETFRDKLAAILLDMKARAFFIRSMPIGQQELKDEIFNYVMSIDHHEELEKEWVLSNKPYPIALTLKKIQETLKTGHNMDVDCFNLAVRKLAFEELQILKGTTKNVLKHYMDLKFCDACEFSRGDQFRAKLNAQHLAKLVLSWPWTKYNVSKCRSILVPCSNSITGTFMLFVLDLKDEVVTILDPVPIHMMFSKQPLRKYLCKIKRASTVFQSIMKIECQWNENVYLWDHTIPNDIEIITDSELSGYYVLLFMRAWDGERLQALTRMDACELRKQFLIHLLTYKENQCTCNIPEVLRDRLGRYISLTNGKA